MQTTPNLGLNKIELNDSPPDITVQDPNWDSIDKHLFTAVNYQKAGGTGTVITLNEVTLVDGYCKTFIATANNGGAATTINTKPLFKPGTTVAPKLITGKAYTIWYDLTGDCFFIRASASGTATADKTLAPWTISNDDDIDVAGTIPTKSAQTYTPSTVDQIIAAAQYLGGNQTIKGDANLLASNILSGKTIFNVAGTVIAGKRWASGTAITSTTQVLMKTYDGGGSFGYFYPLTITGLAFNPRIVMAFDNGDYLGSVFITDSEWGLSGHSAIYTNGGPSLASNLVAYNSSYSDRMYTMNGGFKIGFATSGLSVTWIAIE